MFEVGSLSLRGQEKGVLCRFGGWRGPGDITALVPLGEFLAEYLRLQFPGRLEHGLHDTILDLWVFFFLTLSLNESLLVGCQERGKKMVNSGLAVFSLRFLLDSRKFSTSANI